MLFAQPKKTGHAELSPLVTLCCRITRPKERLAKPFFYLVLSNHFLTHHLRQYFPVLAEIRKIIHDFLAKVFVHYKKNGWEISSRIV